ncbi:MAG: ROK family protein [Balneolales bacterium]
MAATYIGIDLGATNIRLGLVKNMKLDHVISQPLPTKPTVPAVLDQIETLIEGVGGQEACAIGIGVPSVIDIEEGMVYEVQNIPGWDAVPLKKLLEERTHIPVCINNDANCFALGEKFYGAGKAHSNFVALIMGTGFAGGVVLNDKLYNGANCGAGEFGLLPYKNSIFEDYCSGQFFKKVSNEPGEHILEKAVAGNSEAKKIFEQFGHHVGEAIKAVMYAYDPGLVILGGGVSKGYPVFKDSMWKQISTIAYSRSAERLAVKVSDTKQIAVLGASALCMEVDSLQIEN